MLFRFLIYHHKWKFSFFQKKSFNVYFLFLGRLFTVLLQKLEKYLNKKERESVCACVYLCGGGGWRGSGRILFDP